MFGCVNVKNLIMLLLWFLRFSQECNEGCWSCGLWCCIAGYVVSGIRKECATFNFMHSRSLVTLGCTYPAAQPYLPEDRNPPLSLFFSSRLLILVVGLKIAFITNFLLKCINTIFFLCLVHWSNTCCQCLCKDSPLNKHFQKNLTLVVTYH
jgi:hypothetical protein